MNNLAEQIFWNSVSGLRFDGGAGNVNYVLNKLRGFGGYGAVFEADRCRGDAFEEAVAVKLFLIDLRNPNDLTRKMNELATQTRETHKHIVATPPHGMGAVTLSNVQGKPSALFMELELADKDLEDEADRIKADSAKLLRLLTDVAQGLAFLHERDCPVVHRDIKPGNLLWFEKQGVWKLGDLGLARVLSQRNAPSHSKPIGTNWYMAPEAFKGEVLPANDMWSLGALLVWLLTGKEPFGADTETPEEIMNAVLHGAPDLGKNPLPAPFDRIVAGCLVKDSRKRITAGEVLGLLGGCWHDARYGKRSEGVLNLLGGSGGVVPLKAFRDPFLSGSGAGPEMIWLPKGELMMGSKKYDGEQPMHKVGIGYALAVGKYPVTFEEWDAYTAEVQDAHKPDDNAWGRGRRPVINVNWEDAQDYCDWLSRKTGQRYRLLSEAEWEYACRAGTTTAWYWGDSEAEIGRHAVYTGNSNNKTAEVGSKRPNAWGLRDMSGNVWEWVEDCWNKNYEGAPKDGSAWKSGDCAVRVLRGGSWYGFPDSARSAFRFRYDASDRFNSIGFRLARMLP